MDARGVDARDPRTARCEMSARRHEKAEISEIRVVFDIDEIDLVHDHGCCGSKHQKPAPPETPEPDSDTRHPSIRPTESTGLSTVDSRPALVH